MGKLAPWIEGINQAYFMCMFFFISGYFTPSSLNRKGVREFFHDKFMRLGLPLFAFFFVMSGFIDWFANAVVLGQAFPENYWSADTGPPWFLQVLLLFNMAFVVCMGTDQLPIVRCPHVAVIMGLGAVLGLVQGLFLVSGLTLWNIPLAMGALPFDILFFCAGCVAKNNKWLEDFQQAMQGRCTLWSVRIMTAALMLQRTIQAFLRPMVGPFHTVSTGGAAPEVPHFNPSELFLSHMLDFALDGLFTMSMSMTVIELFSTYGNVSNKVSKFFSESAYGVYILHPVVWPMISYTYVLLLRAGGVSISFSVATDGQVVSPDDIGTWRVVLGFLYTLCISNLILWPLAFYLRKLPGLRNVL